MQDGINNNATYVFNSNYNNYTYMYYTNSQVKSTLESWYQTNIGSKTNLASKVVSGNYYCEQAKVKRDSSWTAGNASMTIYSSYTPGFKCESDGNNKGIVNGSIGLLTYDESIYAGGYYKNYGQLNTNYYLYNSNIYWWMMSPFGFDIHSSVWRGGINGDINGSYIDTPCSLRPVINLKSSVQILSGDGTKDNPFVVE